MLSKGWRRCADCHAMVYETLYAEYVTLPKGQRKNSLEEQMEVYKDEINKLLGRAKRGTQYKEEEDTCAYCDYVDEAKEKDWELITFASFYVEMVNKYGGIKKKNKKQGTLW